jgi:putative tryptophan/tyrosine transport system substrate-binding protein
VWPVAAQAQQPDRMRRIGMLSSFAERDVQAQARVAAFRNGLQELGWAEGRDVAIEYRWAEGRYERLPAMVAELIDRQVSVIAALTTPAAIAAKEATATIPIVFTTIGNPVQIGLVASLSRPGGNITGVTHLNVEVGPKLLELLHEVIPTASSIAALVNPTNPNAETLSRSLQAAAGTLGLKLQVLNASTERDIDAALAQVVELRAAGVVIPSDVFLITREEQLASLALHHRIPAVSQTRAFTVAGGLMSYAGSTLDDYRQAGIYTGRVLKGEKPADLPVQQTTKVELIVNLRTAPPDIGAGLAPRGDKARAVAHQSAGRDILAKRMDRGHLVARCQRGDLLAPGE